MITESELLNNGYKRFDTISGSELSYSIYRKKITKFYDTFIYFQFFKKYDTEKYIFNDKNCFKSVSIGTGISMKFLLGNLISGNKKVNNIKDLLKL